MRAVNLQVEEGETVPKREGSSIYQDPAFLVFGQDNGRYSADNSLWSTTSPVKKTDRSFKR